jgi:glycosyltransferase involved in cell wall biosynthesis
VKIAEYLAAGLPVVSTPVGMRGYEYLGARLAVAPLGEFAAAIAKLRPTVSTPGSPVRQPTWTELGRRLHDAYARLLGGAAPPAAAP